MRRFIVLMITILVVAGIMGGTPTLVDAKDKDKDKDKDTVSQNEIVVIPEPSTFLLLGSGLAGLIACSRRRPKE